MTLNALNQIKVYEGTTAIGVIIETLENQMERNENFPTEYKMYEKASQFFQALICEYEKLSNNKLEL